MQDASNNPQIAWQSMCQETGVSRMLLKPIISTKPLNMTANSLEIILEFGSSNVQPPSMPVNLLIKKLFGNICLTSVNNLQKEKNIPSECVSVSVHTETSFSNKGNIAKLALSASFIYIIIPKVTFTNLIRTRVLLTEYCIDGFKTALF